MHHSKVSDHILATAIALTGCHLRLPRWQRLRGGGGRGAGRPNHGVRRRGAREASRPSGGARPSAGHANMSEA
jgi:hypothetical protein